MPKTCTGRKRGIPRSIPSHLIGRQTEAGDQGTERRERKDSTFLGISRSKYFSYCQKCFKSLFSICGKFHSVGFTRLSNGEYVLLSTRSRILHFAAVACYIAVGLAKLWITIQFLVHEDLGIKSFLCIAFATLQVATGVIGVPTVIRPRETIDLLNSWSYVSTVLEDGDAATKFHPLRDLSACLKVISIFCATQGVVVGVSLLSLIMTDLPLYLLPMAERFGIMPHGIFSSFTWQITFAPLEGLSYLPLLSLSSFSGSIFFTGTGALSIYMQPLK